MKWPQPKHDAHRNSEKTRDMWGWSALERLWQDARYGLRMMRRSPGFTAVAVLTLALGIGANTAMFSIFDAVMLRPLPVRDQGKLVVVKWTARTLPRNNGYSSYGDCAEDRQRSQTPGGCSLSVPMFQRIRTAGAGVFSGVGAYTSESSILLTGNGPARQVSAQLVSGDFFPTLGVRPELGRMLSPADDLPSAAPAIVLSYGYWQQEFGGSPSVIGRTVWLNDVPFTIVGVAGPQFGDLTPGNEKNLWLTFAEYPRLNIPRPHNLTNSDRMNDYTEWFVIVIGRLREGVSLAQAQSVVNAVFRNAMLNGPAPPLQPADNPSARLVLAQEGLNGIRYWVLSPLYALVAAAGILLLIACANVAGLSLAGATARRKEVAIRLALGAARGRIARQLLTENILVSLLGGACGGFVAYWGVRGITALSSGFGVSINAFPPIRLDFRVMAFAVAISVVTGALVALVPIFRSGDVDLTPALKESANAPGNPARGRRRRIKLSDALVVAQIALAVVVLAAAGLLARTFTNLGRTDPGFDTTNLLLFSVDPTLAGYKSAQIQILYGELQTRLAAIPGVVSTSYSSYALLAGAWSSTSVHVPGLQQSDSVETTTQAVGPGYFDTMRIPILSGRAFSPADFEQNAAASSAQAMLPAIINQAFAQKYFGAQNPLGLVLKGGTDSNTGHVGLNSASPRSSGWQIVGIARDTRYDSLRRPTPPLVYLPLGGGGAYFELRTVGNPEAIMPELRSIVAQMGENLPLLRITTMTDQIRKDISRERVMAQLSGVFGALSLLLAAIGIYGVISYIAVQRTHEIGIRMALGASPRNILASVLGHGGRVAAAGIALGLLGAAGVARLMTSMLYGVSGADPASFAGVAALLVFVALAACYIPARRATRVDPMEALRYE